MKLPVVLRPGETGYIVAEVPVLLGCISQGRNVEEALANIRKLPSSVWRVQKKRGGYPTTS